MNRFRPSVSMLGWALNEEQNLEAYVDRAEAFLRTVTDDFELVLINDGSTDRTWEIACELQRTRPWFRPIANDRNRGVGYNYAHAIKQARKQYFLVQTVDWSYDLTEFARCFDLLQQYDMLQGIRPGGVSLAAFGRRSDNRRKAFVSFSNYLLIRVLFRLPIGDYQNITVCPTRLAQGLTLEAGSSFANPEVVLKCWWQGASIYEVPVPFLRRERGTATGTRWRSIARSVQDVLGCWLSWVVLGRYPNRRGGTVVRLTDRPPSSP